jgi:PTH1 family peptidyl-tRNA hydrolase
LWLLVGLGNPGRDYEGSRHNIGFLVIDEIARRAKVGGFRGKFGGEMAQGELGGHKVTLLKPMEYMNLSGQAVGRTADFFQISAKETVVVHDEADLDVGRLKLKVGGGHAGHKGVASIMEAIGPDFARVRCGVGRPGGNRDMADYVLSGFAKSERPAVDLLVQEAADAVLEVVGKGAAMAMNQFNQREKSE